MDRLPRGVRRRQGLRPRGVFCGKGAECGDAGELIGRERRAEGFACSGNERARGAALDGDHADGSEIFQGIPSRGVEDLEGGLGSARPGVLAAEGLDFLTGCRVDFVDDGEDDRGVAAGNPGLLAMLEARAKGLAGPVGEMCGGVGNGCGRRGFLWICGREDLLEALEERVAAGFEFDVGKVGAVEDALGKAGLCGEGAEHGVLDGVFGDEVDDGDGAELAFAPGAGDALLELGRIPRQVAIDDDAGVLEIESHAA